MSIELVQAATRILRSGPVLVTGANGFIGRNLVGRLLQLGVDTVVLVRRVGRRLTDIAPSLRIVECDLADADQLAAKLAAVRPAVVFHLAAGVVASAPPSEIVQSNVVGTINLLNAVNGDFLKQFIYCGTGSEYGVGSGLSESSPLRPTNMYGVTKAAGHLAAHCFRRAHHLPIISVRPFTLYGPWEPPRRLIPHVCCSALDGLDIPLTPAEQERDFLFVDDAVDAFVRMVAVAASDDMEAINVCSGIPVKVRDVVTEIVALSGGKGRPQFGALPYRGAGDARAECGDGSLARRVLDWSPQTSLTDGLLRTLNWVAGHRALLKELA
jgi:nucleoside-diphosphate-sugar epimerase